MSSWFAWPETRQHTKKGERILWKKLVLAQRAKPGRFFLRALARRVAVSILKFLFAFPGATGTQRHMSTRVLACIESAKQKRYSFRLSYHTAADLRARAIYACWRRTCTSFNR